MRLDRLMTLYFVHPLRKILCQKEGVRISILMYHSILDQDDPGRHPYFQTNTRPEVFARQMQFLADNDYQVISLSEAVSLLTHQPSNQATIYRREAGSSLVSQFPNQPVTSSGAPITSPRKYVVLTWDDAHRDYHDRAWPILKKFGYAATMFLPTGYIDNERKRLNGKDCLTWDEAKALAADGSAFEAHTVSHVQLYGMERQKIDYELKYSRQQIEERLGKPVKYYAYALAFPDQDQGFLSFYLTSLRQAGYLAAVSTRIGTAHQGDNLYMLKRLPVNSCDDEKLFRAKLEGGYDWLHGVQVMKKKVKFAG
jgi:peptidoglycan/xylan/chitin deacetylase (PgdA/CDA1 family)